MAFGQPTKGKCSRCGSTTWLQNKSKKLCRACAYKTNQEAKAVRRAPVEDQPDTQKELFLEIYEQNKDHWVSEVSGTPLPPKPGPGATPYKEGMFWACFAHLVRKGKYPEFKLRRDNIALLLPDEHDQYDNRPWSLMDPDTGQPLDPRWAAIFARRDLLLDEAKASALGR